MLYTRQISLTIVIPVANFTKDEFKIRRYIEQTREFGVQVILVIDDSNPESLARAKDLMAENHTQNGMILQFSGRNPGGARNEAIKYVKTQWLQFCDSDDSINIKTIVELLNSLDLANCEAVIAGFNSTQNVSRQKNRIDFLSRRLLSLGIILNPGIWRWIFRAESVKNLKFPETRMGEDQLFIAKFLTNNPRLINRQDLLVYNYFTNVQGNLTSQYSTAELRKTLEEFKALSIKKAQLRNSLLVIALYFRLTLTLIRRDEKVFKTKRYAMYFSLCFKSVQTVLLALSGRLEKLG